VQRLDFVDTIADAVEQFLEAFFLDDLYSSLECKHRVWSDVMVDLSMIA
jgi:hypothetical protein